MYSSMSTTKDENIKNLYNSNMKTHPLLEVSSPQNPPTQYLQEREEEEITPQVRKLAPKKRIRYFLRGKSNKEWKASPLSSGARQAKQEIGEKKEEERKS